MTGIFQTWFCS